MDKPILYSFRRCPYAMRARMALYYSQQVCELREVALKNKPAEMLAVSAKGTVPILVLDCEGTTSIRVIDESLDIMCWAVNQSDPDLWNDDINEFASASEHPIIRRNDTFFTRWLTRYKYADRYPEATQQDYFEKCGDYLHDLNHRLVANSAGHHFIESPKLSFLDAAIFPFVRQCFAVDSSITQALALPELKAWHNYLIESDLFKNVMSKYPMWTADQTETLIFK